MKNRFLFVVCILALGTVSAYSQTTPPQEGEELVLKLPESGSFEYLDVPRNNFIMKQGGIVDIDQLDNTTVVVDQVRETRKGTQLVLKRKDGNRFFKSHRYLTASWPEIAESNELLPSR
ncbi:MAG: hypothetical protein EP302_02285 [Bacteroidetes bacterium]|jgi:hypothetical protein|nr:MAG: hypothetical protein EP302_02285 [Bacteroidota bacterium]UCE69182.1 MAG: hypothetical protein JSW57_12240 [Flavobacteriaceae bacterium]